MGSNGLLIRDLGYSQNKESSLKRSSRSRLHKEEGTIINDVCLLVCCRVNVG